MDTWPFRLDPVAAENERYRTSVNLLTELPGSPEDRTRQAAWFDDNRILSDRRELARIREADERRNKLNKLSAAERRRRNANYKARASSGPSLLKEAG